jgi:hypothetical protein
MVSGIGGGVEQTAQQMVGRRQYHGQLQPENSGKNALAFPTNQIRVAIWDFMFSIEHSKCHGARSIAISPTYTDRPIPNGQHAFFQPLISQDSPLTVRRYFS